LFLSVVFAVPHLSLKKKASTPTHPTSSVTNWKHDLTPEEHSTLLQLESEIESAKDHHSKKIATRKHT